jgi:hypothetical protein
VLSWVGSPEAEVGVGERERCAMGERDMCCGLWETEEGEGNGIRHAWVSGWVSGVYFLLN